MDQQIELTILNQGGSKDENKAYEKVKDIHHPGNPGSDKYKNSGVTIGYGIDLGKRKPVQIQRILKDHIPKAMVQTLKKAGGLKGEKARDFVQKNKITIEKQACKNILIQQIKRQKDDLIRILNKEENKKKFGIKDGESFFNSLKPSHKCALLDTKFLGLNTPAFRQKIIPYMKAEAEGNSTQKTGQILNQNIQNAYKSKAYNLRASNVKQILSSNGKSLNKENLNNWSNEILTNLGNTMINGIQKNIAEKFHNAITKNGNEIGGVDLSYLESLTFDGYYSGKDFIQLHRGKQTDVRMKDLIVPLKIMFDDQIKNKNISISIDPSVPNEPDGPFQQKIYYPKQLEGTYYGQIMIQADFIMKQMKLGIDQNGKPYKYPQSLKKVGLDFESILAFREKGMQERTRQWIVIKDVQKIKMTNQKLAIGNVTMGIQAKVQKIGSNGCLQDSDQKPSKSTQMFCKLFTQHYNLIAKEYPQFQILKRLAKAVILARSMKLKGCQINYDLINHLYQLQKTDKSPNKIATLKHQYFYEKISSKLTIMGGCQLNFNIQKDAENPEKLQLQTVQDQFISEAEANSYVPFIFQNTQMCHHTGCKKICSPQYYSIKNKQCRQHTRMTCFMCYNSIKIRQKYKDLNSNKNQKQNMPQFCHAQCFKCNQCQKIIDAQYIQLNPGEFFHKECIPKQILGECSICNKQVLSNQSYMKRGQQELLHKQCLLKMKCKSCNKQIPLETMKYLGEDTYHKNCIKCQFCNKVIQQAQINTLNNGFCHAQCVPKVLCYSCKQPISGQYLNIAENPYHQGCLKCQKCKQIIDPSSGIKKNDKGQLFHGKC